MIDVPLVIQEPNFCGPACLAMLAKFYGKSVSQEQIAEWAGTTNLGTSLSGMLDAAERLGFQAHHFDNASVANLLSLIELGIPPIVDWFADTTGHYCIVVDVDENARTLTLRDPDTDVDALRIFGWDEFEEVWFDFEGRRPEKESFFVRRIIMVWPTNQPATLASPPVS